MIQFRPDPHAPIRVASVYSMAVAINEAHHLQRSGTCIDLVWAAIHLSAAIEWLEHQAVHCPGPRRRENRRFLARHATRHHRCVMQHLNRLLDDY